MRHFAASFAASIIVMVAPVKVDASIITIEFSGTIVEWDGFQDQLGMFGPVGSSLNGKSFKAKYYFDLSAVHGRIKNEYQDAIGGGNSVNGPWFVKSSIEINNIVYDFGTPSGGSVSGVAGSSWGRVDGGINVQSNVNNNKYEMYNTLYNPKFDLTIESIPYYWTSSLEQKNFFSGTSKSDFTYNYFFFNSLNQVNGASNYAVTAGKFETTSVVFNGGIAPPAPPPTTLELARMSQQAYEDVPIDIGNFKFIGRYSGSAGVSIVAYRNGDNIVTAIRGTELSGGLVTALKNITADNVFSDMNNNPVFQNTVRQTAIYLDSLYSQCSSCNFFVTGHSLGGAIAEIVGSYTNLPSFGFNSPGVNSSIYNQLNNIDYVKLISQINFQNTGQNTTYRLYGDIISTIGPIGRNVITFDSFINPEIDKNPSLFVNYSHSMLNLFSSIAADNEKHVGIIGPTASITEEWVGAKFIGLGQNIYTFSTYVSEGLFTTFDPESGAAYQFSALDGSPLFSAVSLPFFEEISQYNLSYLINGIWSKNEMIVAGQRYYFSNPTNSFLFSPVNAANQPTTINGAFVFDVAFASSGQFYGNLSIRSGISAVPESSTWISIIIGFSFIGFILRKNVNIVSIQ